MKTLQRNRKQKATNNIGKRSKNIDFGSHDDASGSSSRTLDLTCFAPSFKAFDRRRSTKVYSTDREGSSSSTYSSSTRRRTMDNSSDEFTLNKLNTSDLGIYGREIEITRLEAAVENQLASALSNPALITVKGYSGTGKSSLVEKLKPYVQTKGGIFAIGKFNMESLVEPYTAFSIAFTSVIEQLLLNATEDELFLIRESASEIMGTDFEILLDVIPNLLMLLGDKGDDHDDQITEITDYVDGHKAMLRLKFYFQSFVRCICRQGCPLVIVLDDVQWADNPSLELIDAFLSVDLEYPALMIVIYRDNEVDCNHPFTKLLDRIRERDIEFTEVELRGLDTTACHRIVSTILRMEDSTEIKHLAELVRSKTGGNPFFMLQFLQSLIDEDILTYNFGTLRWYWNDDDVQNTMVTDNVVTFLTARISKLDSDMQEVLQVASFLGRCFERSDLVDVVESLVAADALHTNFDETQAVNAVVNQLVDVGMFEQIHSTLCFAHDQIQAAASESVPEKTATSLRCQIAKHLMKKSHETRLNEHEVFLAASLSESSVDTVTDVAERHALGCVNLLAGDASMQKSAFDAALRYAERGLKFLGPNPWDSYYELSTQLHSIAVVAAYCTGELDKMERFISDVLLQVGPIEDKIGVYRTRLASYSAQQRFKEGIRDGLLLLKDLGLKAPRNDASLLTVLRELLWTKQVMRKHSMSSLVALPTMEDRRLIWATGVIQNISVMTFFSNKNLFLVLWLRCVTWSTEYGVNENTLVAFCIWGSLSHTMFGDLDRAIMFADAVLQLAKKVDCRATFARIIFITYGYIYHWRYDMRASIRPSWLGYVRGMEAGNLEDAMYNLGLHDVLQYTTSSRPLDALLVDCESHVKMMKDYKQEVRRNSCLCILQLIRKLVGKDKDPNALSGSVMVEEEMLSTAREAGNELLVAWIAVFAKELAYLFGDYMTAAVNAAASKRFGVSINEGYCLVPRHFFFSAMNAIALYRLGIERRKNWTEARKIAKKMKKWQSRGNPNVVHMTYLLDAEFASIKGDKKSATELYKKSIRIATRHGFLNDTALAHEKAADYHIACDDTYWASHHVREAVRCYKEWMADAKVEQLRCKYDLILASAEARHRSILDTQRY